MGPFFVAPLERKLKDLFICGSDSYVDNVRVHPCPPFAFVSRWPQPCPALRAAAKPVLMALLLTALAWPAARASDKSDKSDMSDHERARAAVQAGQVLPLPTLLERVQRTHPGQVLELELDRDDGRWIYELKLLQASGQLLKLDVDAASGQVLKARAKQIRKHEDRQDRKQDDQPGPEPGSSKDRLK